MSELDNTFEATEATRSLFPTLGKSIEDFAFAQANEFIEAGQTAREATSIVANMMIRAAWTVASIAVLSEGGEPDADKFRSTVEAQINAITFKPKGGAA